MANEWHFTQNGQQAAAPVSSAELRRLAKAGQLLPTDLVWQEGMANWAPANSIKGLFSARSGEMPVADDVLGNKGTGEKPPPVTDPDVETEDEPLHPLIHLVLAALTGGLWGLWVGYTVCRDFREDTPRRARDDKGRPLGTPRHPLGVLLLSCFTGGLYLPYWVATTLGACNNYLGVKEFPERTEMTLSFIFPPYMAYVALFRLPDAIRRVQAEAGMKDPVVFPATVFFLSPCVFWALPVLAMAYQEALNQAWTSAP